MYAACSCAAGSPLWRGPVSQHAQLCRRPSQLEAPHLAVSQKEALVVEGHGDPLSPRQPAVSAGSARLHGLLADGRCGAVGELSFSSAAESCGSSSPLSSIILGGQSAQDPIFAGPFSSWAMSKRFRTVGRPRGGGPECTAAAGLAGGAAGGGQQLPAGRQACAQQ